MRCPICGSDLQVNGCEVWCCSCDYSNMQSWSEYEEDYIDYINYQKLSNKKN